MKETSKFSHTVSFLQMILDVRYDPFDEKSTQAGKV